MDEDKKDISALINELSDICGIEPEYWDIFGNKHILTVMNKKALLGAMKLKIDSSEDIVREINERKYKNWKSFIEPVHVVSVSNQPLKIPVYVPVPEGKDNKLTLSWYIEDENGEKDTHIISGEIDVLEQQWIGGTRHIKINIIDTVLRDIGYYIIHVECKHVESIFPDEKNSIKKSSRIIVTPDTCYIPPELRNSKTWGLSVNLYAINSARNWGIGDFADLREVVSWVSKLKGDLIGINPLHAIPNTKPFGISPYSPISRLYKNFIYLDVTSIPEVLESEDTQSIMKSEQCRKKLNRLKREKFIDYEKIASLKEEILRQAFDFFHTRHYIEGTPRGMNFRKYISEEGHALESFALFSVLWECMKEMHKAFAWQQWPQEFHSPSNETLLELKKKYEKDVLFYQYIQWLIDEQLRETSELAKRLGLVVGLYHDLAIGSVGGGSDVWANQNVVGEADVGAPPDDFNPNGQNWGFPPLIPEKLKATEYELFIQTIRKNMKYGGALRIDHAPGLFRLFWIPHGMLSTEGAYVRYPSEDLIRIIALESVRNKAMVIAEDLGTVGENVREMLKQFQMLSYKLFYFERNYPDPSFKSPDEYPDMALCAVTTHDLPTLYGYWSARDLKIKKQLGMYPDKNLWQMQVEERERDKRLIVSALKYNGIIPDDYPSEPIMTQDLCLAIYKYLTETPCKLLLVSLDDIIGTLDQMNMPGTVGSYPNWVQKIPLTLEKLLSDSRFLTLSDMLRENNTSLEP